MLIQKIGCRIHRPAFGDSAQVHSLPFSFQEGRVFFQDNIPVVNQRKHSFDFILGRDIRPALPDAPEDGERTRRNIKDSVRQLRIFHAVLQDPDGVFLHFDRPVSGRRIQFRNFAVGQKGRPAAVDILHPFPDVPEQFHAFFRIVRLTGKCRHFYGVYRAEGTK